jgi:transcriptional regulator with XRE-family HTH domain
MDRVEIGKKIERLRKSKGLTQNKLATLAGLAPSYIPDLEKGRKCPTVEALDNICYALGTTLADFFNEQDEKIKADKLSTLSEEQKKLLNDFLNSL